MQLKYYGVAAPYFKVTKRCSLVYVMSLCLHAINNIFAVNHLPVRAFATCCSCRGLVSTRLAPLFMNSAISSGRAFPVTPIISPVNPICRITVVASMPPIRGITEARGRPRANHRQRNTRPRPGSRPRLSKTVKIPVHGSQGSSGWSVCSRRASSRKLGSTSQFYPPLQHRRQLYRRVLLRRRLSRLPCRHPRTREASGVAPWSQLALSLDRSDTGRPLLQ